MNILLWTLLGGLLGISVFLVNWYQPYCEVMYLWYGIQRFFS